MKRRFHTLWMVVLVCLNCGFLGGCRKEEAPRLAAESQKEFQAAEAGEGALQVVTDMDWMAQWYRGRTQAYQGQKTFARILDYFGGMPGGTEVQLEVLPAEDGSYQAALTRMRTEIMAGGGPDVCYLSGFGGCEDSLPTDTLFPNPEHAMASGFFLSLDRYMEEAQFMEPEKLLDSVMEAGRYEGAQYILPMFYRLPMGVLLREAGPEDLPSGWDEAAASQEEDIQRMYALAAASSVPGFREIAFGRIADNVGEELLLDKDTLFQRTREALSLYEKFPGQLIYEENNAHYWSLDYLEYVELSGGASGGGGRLTIPGGNRGRDRRRGALVRRQRQYQAPGGGLLHCGHHAEPGIPLRHELLEPAGGLCGHAPSGRHSPWSHSRTHGAAGERQDAVSEQPAGSCPAPGSGGGSGEHHLCLYYQQL